MISFAPRTIDPIDCCIEFSMVFRLNIAFSLCCPFEKPLIFFSCLIWSRNSFWFKRRSFKSRCISSSLSSNQSLDTFFRWSKVCLAASCMIALRSSQSCPQTRSFSLRNDYRLCILSVVTVILYFFGGFNLSLRLNSKKAINNLWSVKQSGFGSILVTLINCLAWELASKWSIWWKCFDQGCCQVVLRQFFIWNIVLIIDNWNREQNSSNIKSNSYFQRHVFQWRRAMKSSLFRHGHLNHQVR